MPYLDKTTPYDRSKGYVDFECPSCLAPVRVNNDGQPYAGLTLVGCPYCRCELVLRTNVEVTYEINMYLAHRSSSHG